MIQWFFVAVTLLCDLERGVGRGETVMWMISFHQNSYGSVLFHQRWWWGCGWNKKIWYKSTTNQKRVRISPFSHVWRAGPIPLFPLCYCRAAIGTTSACPTDNNASWDTSYLNLTPTTLKFVVRTNRCSALNKRKVCDYIFTGDTELCELSI